MVASFLQGVDFCICGLHSCFLVSGHGLGGLSMQMLPFLILIVGCWHTVGSSGLHSCLLVNGLGLGGLAMQMLLFLIRIGGCWHTVGSDSRDVFWFGGCCPFVVTAVP